VLARTDVIASTTTEAMVEEGLPAGEYVYICTVPGHTQAMQGTLIVE
jgi:azurin